MQPAPSYPFAQRLNHVETSAIREVFKLLGRPGIISFAGGFPDSALFDVAHIEEAARQALTQQAAQALQYGATEGFMPLREQLAALMQARGASVRAEQLIVTTGSQQALDLVGKTLAEPGCKVIVEGPTFWPPFSAFASTARKLSAPRPMPTACSRAHWSGSLTNTARALSISFPLSATPAGPRSRWSAAAACWSWRCGIRP